MCSCENWRAVTGSGLPICLNCRTAQSQSFGEAVQVRCPIQQCACPQSVSDIVRMRGGAGSVTGRYDFSVCIDFPLKDLRALFERWSIDIAVHTQSTPVPECAYVAASTELRSQSHNCPPGQAQQLRIGCTSCLYSWLVF